MEETRATPITEENQKLLEEMLLLAKSVPRENDLAKNPVMDATGVDSGIGMVATVQDAGMCIIYETKTGEVFKVLRYMLPQYLQVVEKDGKRRFQTNPPTTLPKRGARQCWLHPEGENRNHYDELGLPTCKKSNMTSPYMVEQHMRKRHPSAFATIDAEKKDAESKRREAREEALMKVLSDKVSAPVVVETTNTIDPAVIDAVEDRVLRRVNKKKEEI